MNENPALTFAITLKRWFAANGWPQRITDVWAHDPGIQSPTGPWASQMCNAMKAAASELDYFEEKGIPAEHVGTHSLRMGRVNALVLSGYSNTQIQKMGRWRGATSGSSEPAAAAARRPPPENP